MTLKFKAQELQSPWQELLRIKIHWLLSLLRLLLTLDLHMEVTHSQLKELGWPQVFSWSLGELLALLSLKSLQVQDTLVLPRLKSLDPQTLFLLLSQAMESRLKMEWCSLNIMTGRTLKHGKVTSLLKMETQSWFLKVWMLLLILIK